MPETIPNPTPITRALADYFNTQEKPKSLFLGPPMGLIENLDNKHPAIWELYKKLKSMDWEESEIDISSCRDEFKTRPPEITRLMISTLAFQFEADSNAAHIARLMYPFINNTELMCYITEVAKNECLTPDHQVLTTEGWKNIDEITTQDKVAQWDQGYITFVHPTDCIKLEHSGKLHTYSSPFFMQRVTPTHRMPTYSEDSIGNRTDVKFTRSSDMSMDSSDLFPVSGVTRGSSYPWPSPDLSTKIALMIAANCIGKLKITDDASSAVRFKTRTPVGKPSGYQHLMNVVRDSDWPLYKTSPEKASLTACIPSDIVGVDLMSLHWLNVSEYSISALLDMLQEFERWSKSDYFYRSYNEEDAVKVLTMLHLSGNSGYIQAKPTKKGVLSYTVFWHRAPRTPVNEVVRSETDYTGSVYCLSVPSTAFMVKHNNVISVTGNCLHALSYKFIVESSFDDPNDFLKEVREIKEAFLRLDNVNKIFQELLEVGANYTLGIATDETAIRKLLLKAWVSLYALERIQFISSFAVTFGLAEQGLMESMYVPIAKLVQKIATDEWNIHVAGDKAVLKNELAIPEVFALWLEILPEVQHIVDSVVRAEITWLNSYLFKDSKVTAGLECDRIAAFVEFTAQDVYDFLKLPITWTRHTSNPLPYMDKWLVIDNNQASPQEESIGNYLLGGFIDDSNTLNANRYAGLGVTL